ncbi:hypothetical protein Thein_0593 [Thermodesulfatator indicus DSM 15286]|uniref:Uncharacterized protein n=1 Tax=Thermodesulfatator indicus (strain DSM 15286 / JCM 11887 / CIR29812) TaxID=667014 RepID=F8ABG2_THEID|nr:DUF5752 family protein [Thermodesulfatator indicus]AEH44474.1 hypothetical protein Thein_0593 [Thermodesulfatator indicus DSM 15286]
MAQEVLFHVKDCSLVSISLGVKAYVLAELLDHVREVEEGCIYHHFWARQLRPSFDHPEFHNDFAAWVHRELHDYVLAERLNLIAPHEFENLEELREELINVLEERFDEHADLPWRKADKPFYFVKSQIVVFDTGRRISHPKKVAEVLPGFSQGSIFYHFIDARRRTENGVDDFRAWLSAFGEEYEKLSAKLASIDPYFFTLTEIREQLLNVFKNFFGAQHE